MLGGVGPTELVIILFIILVIFGAGKLPEIGGALGKGIKNFKNEMRDDTPEEVASNDAPKKVEGTSETAAAEAPKETEKQA